MFEVDEQKLNEYGNIFFAAYNMKDVNFLVFGAIAIDKHKFHYPKNPTWIDDVYIYLFIYLFSIYLTLPIKLHFWHLKTRLAFHEE